MQEKDLRHGNAKPPVNAWKHKVKVLLAFLLLCLLTALSDISLAADAARQARDFG
ncbi:MAG: hypothetical protein LBE33_08775 [Zoogloeaceae bacterium]|jgi:hypothetical protein|nr:hypothetical protein [Zoogloeaceae bacterium]